MIAATFILQEVVHYAEPGFEVSTESVFIVENVCVLDPDLKDSLLGVFLGKGGNK